MFLIDPGFFNIVKCKQRNAMTLSQLLSSFLGTPKSDNFNFERLLNLSIALSMEQAWVWWIQRHIYVVIVWVHRALPPRVKCDCTPLWGWRPSLLHCLCTHQLRPIPHFNYIRYNEGTLTNIPSDREIIYCQPFIFFNIRNLSSFVWSWWLPWSLKRLRQKEVPSRWWKTGQLFESEQHFIIF